MNDNKQKEQADCAASGGENQDSPEICFDKAEIAEMMLALDEKNCQLEELGNRLLRLQADFDNFRRRTKQEKEEMSQVVTSGMITQLLPVMDSFERALATAPGQDAGQLLAGVELVCRQFTQILERFDVKPIIAVGAQFDPALHEAVMRVEDPCQADGLVVGELQKGYIAHSKVLRPSMVKVVNNG